MRLFRIGLAASVVLAVVPYLLPERLVFVISPWWFVGYYSVIGLGAGVCGIAWIVSEARRVFACPDPRPEG